MEVAMAIEEQFVIMFVFVLIGYMFFRRGLITQEGSRSLANLLVFLALPSIVVNSFSVEFTSKRCMALLLGAVLTVVALGIAVGVAKRLRFKNEIDHFAAVFSNPGFFGVPLIAAVCGADSVFYIAVYIAFLNILQWTYGIAVLKKEKMDIDIKKICLSPFVISLLAGLILFFGKIQLPSILDDIIRTSASINMPLAMIVTGIYLAQTDIKNMLLRWSLYKVSFVRLAVIPVVVAAMLSFVPDTYRELKLCILIAAACPVGTNVAVYSQIENCDYTYAVQTVVMSTLLSVVSLPIIVGLAQIIWR